MLKNKTIKNRMPSLGKISPEVFNEIIYPNLGYKSPYILKGPHHGIDCGVVDMGDNKVMAVTCDPFYIVPNYGFEKASWFAFHILASDISTTGLKPEFFSVDLNLPPNMKDEEFHAMWESLSAECEKYKVSIITGHTAKYAGCNYPMIGGAFMMARGDKDKYITPDMAEEGDLLIITKGAAIEAAAIMAATFSGKIIEAFGSEFNESAQKLFYSMSTLEDALTVSKYGIRDKGATTMHDATECGIYGGVFEVARASHKGIRLYKDKIILDERVKKICDLFKMDPYSSISEGSLIITARPNHAENIVRELSQKKIKASICGEVVNQNKGMKLVDKGIEKILEHPIIDPFWQAFEREINQKS